ncbi:MAG: hypothetical protein AAB578_10410, partial [Elusimicrobiota bacterium]
QVSLSAAGLPALALPKASVSAGPSASRASAGPARAAAAVFQAAPAAAPKEQLNSAGKAADGSLEALEAEPGTPGEDASAPLASTFDGAEKSGPGRNPGLALSGAQAPVSPALSGLKASPSAVASVRKGPGRRDWTIGGKKAEYLDGGGFKDILIHPKSHEHLLTLFTQAGASREGGSRIERDREAARRAPLEVLGLAPRMVSKGMLEVQEGAKSRPAAYLIQERVFGVSLGRASAADLPKVRTLFDALVAARIRLEDRVKMLDNIMIGHTASRPGEQAWVVDAGEAERVPPISWWDRLLRKPDPLRAYYDEVLRDISRTLPARPAAAGR